MRQRIRLVCLASSVAFGVAWAQGAEITVSGPQGHQTALATGASVSPQATISYGQYKCQQTQLSNGLQAIARPRMSTKSLRYAGGFSIRRGMDRRGPFRYRASEYRKRRFDSLRTPTHRGRFGGWGDYASGIRYSTSFGRTTGFRSTVRYSSR